MGESQARNIASILGVSNDPDLAEIGILLYQALTPCSGRETAFLAALKETAPLWTRAVEDGDELIGMVLDFGLLELIAEGPNGEKLRSGLYDIMNAKFIDKPYAKVVFVRSAHITNFRRLFLRYLYERADAEQAAEG